MPAWGIICLLSLLDPSCLSAESSPLTRRNKRLSVVLQPEDGYVHSHRSGLVDKGGNRSILIEVSDSGETTLQDTSQDKSPPCEASTNALEAPCTCGGSPTPCAINNICSDTAGTGTATCKPPAEGDGQKQEQSPAISQGEEHQDLAPDGTKADKTTSEVLTTIVYAKKQEPEHVGLSTNAKIALGVGAGVALLIILAVGVTMFLRQRGAKIGATVRASAKPKVSDDEAA